jgi:hypothetical protein
MICKRESPEFARNSKFEIRFSILFLFFIFTSLLIISGCKINYTFTGASVSPEVKTYSVDFFPNNAPLFQPTLSQTFTEGLRDKIMSQSRLNLVNSGGDLHFEGEITGYSSSPISVQSAEMASVNRLSISVKVKYTNNKDPKQNFDQVFTQYEDYPSSSSLSDVETDLISKIVAKLTEDIFNKALASW